MPGQGLCQGVELDRQPPLLRKKKAVLPRHWLVAVAVEVMAVWCSALGDRFMRGERGRGQWAGSAIASSCQRHGQYRGNTAWVANRLAMSSGASSFRRLCCLRQSRTPNSTAARAALAGQKRVSRGCRRAGRCRACTDALSCSPLWWSAGNGADYLVGYQNGSEGISLPLSGVSG